MEQAHRFTNLISILQKLVAGETSYELEFQKKSKEFIKQSSEELHFKFAQELLQAFFGSSTLEQTKSTIQKVFVMFSVGVQSTVKEAIKVRELLQSELFNNWETSAGPGSKPDDSLIFFERVADYCYDSQGLSISKEKREEVMQEIRSATNTPESDLFGNIDQIEFVEEALELNSKLPSGIFQLNMDFLTHHQSVKLQLREKIEKAEQDDLQIAKTNKELQDLESKIRYAGRAIHLYFKKMREAANEERIEDIRAVARFIMTYKDFNISKKRTKIAEIGIGDTGAGKGDANQARGITPYASGTDGISGCGYLHEHFSKLLFSFKWALDNGMFMSLIDLVYFAGLIGYRNYLDTTNREDEPVVFDGYPRNEVQALFFKNFDRDAIASYYLAIQAQTAIRRNLSRLVKLRMLHQERGDAIADLLWDDGSEITIDEINKLIDEELETVKSRRNLVKLSQVEFQTLQDYVLENLLQSFTEKGLKVVFKPQARFNRYNDMILNQVLPALSSVNIKVTKIDADNLTREEVVESIRNVVNSSFKSTK